MLKVLRHLSAFLLGMLWDVSTLRRIDDIGDNVGLLGGMVVLGLVLALSMRIEMGRALSGWWGATIAALGAGILAYQLMSMTLGLVSFDGMEWPRALCADGCWLPALGADAWDDRIEAIVASGVGMGMGIVGGLTMADPGILGRQYRWLVLFRQFMWGNILSAYVIFYYQASDIGPALLYVVLLLALLGVNEVLPARYRQGMVELTVFQFCAFSFLLYFLPVAGAYLPIGHPDWDPIRAVLLRPGTWTPFVIAAVGAILACTLVSVVGRRGLKLDDVSVAGVAREFRAVRSTMLNRGQFWFVVTLALFGLRWLEAIPPAPLALIDAELKARKMVSRDVRCSGEAVASSSGPFGLWDRFQFPDDRRTWIVLKAKVFAPRHMLVPVSIHWEYFEWPGFEGEWWNPGMWWHETKGGRQVQVPGWEAEGFKVRSCKRIFTGGGRGKPMHPLWRITFTTPGDQSGLEVLRLLDANIPFVAVSANELMDMVPEQEDLTGASKQGLLSLADEIPLTETTAQDLVKHIPVNVPLTGKSAQELIEHIPLSKTSAKDLMKFIPTDIPMAGMPASELVALLEAGGVRLTKDTVPALLGLITREEYKIGRKYFWLESGHYTSD